MFNFCIIKILLQHIQSQDFHILHDLWFYILYFIKINLISVFCVLLFEFSILVDFASPVTLLYISIKGHHGILNTGPLIRPLDHQIFGRHLTHRLKQNPSSLDHQDFGQTFALSPEAGQTLGPRSIGHQDLSLSSPFPSLSTNSSFPITSTSHCSYIPVPMLVDKFYFIFKKSCF